MNTFDPWPFVMGIEDRDGLTEMQQLLVDFALDMDAHRPKTGFDVLLDMARCVGNGIAVPDWLASDFALRLREVSAFAVPTLDDARAFGPLPTRREGDQLSTAALRAKWEDFLRVMFAPGPFPRTGVGFERAAKVTGLSTKQIRKLLPRTRRNVRGHKPQKEVPTAGASAHDPFSLTKRPKS